MFYTHIKDSLNPRFGYLIYKKQKVWLPHVKYLIPSSYKSILKVRIVFLSSSPNPFFLFPYLLHSQNNSQSFGKMSSTLLPDLGTEILIPVCAVVGIVFSLIQWYLVSQVKLSPDSGRNNNNKNGYSENLIEEEE